MSLNQKNSLVSKLLEKLGQDAVMDSYFKIPKDADGRIWSSHTPPNQARWMKAYEKKMDSDTGLSHDEPWITFMALYGLFGDQSQARLKESRLLVNQLLEQSFPKAEKGKTPTFKEITSVHLEVQLRENRTYREYLEKFVFKGEAFHPYKDRQDKLDEKLKERSPNLEGNTHLDALISGKDAADQPTHIFIEAKFLSDISTAVSYVPVRNQIARNIDCAIELMTKRGKDLDRLKDFWFVLLTPAMFRTRKFKEESSKSPYSLLKPDRSRFYCYKMDEYLEPDGLKADLPHWQGVFRDKDWELLSSHIGWLTFEEILQTVERTGTLHKEEKEDYREFFKDRGITEATCP